MSFVITYKLNNTDFEDKYLFDTRAEAIEYLKRGGYEERDGHYFEKPATNFGNSTKAFISFKMSYRQAMNNLMGDGLRKLGFEVQYHPFHHMNTFNNGVIKGWYDFAEPDSELPLMDIRFDYIARHEFYKNVVNPHAYSAKLLSIEGVNDLLNDMRILLEYPITEWDGSNGSKPE